MRFLRKSRSQTGVKHKINESNEFEGTLCNFKLSSSHSSEMLVIVNFITVTFKPMKKISEFIYLKSVDFSLNKKHPL